MLINGQQPAQPVDQLTEGVVDQDEKSLMTGIFPDECFCARCQSALHGAFLVRRQKRVKLSFAEIKYNSGKLVSQHAILRIWWWRFDRLINEDHGRSIEVQSDLCLH